MKKTLIAAIAFLAVALVACQNTGKGGEETASRAKDTEAQIKQRVEEMIDMHEYYDADKILTADLYALQEKAQSVHFWANFFPGFQWDLGTMDACSEVQEVRIEGVKLIDSLHCDVAMRYVDSICYNTPYTLNLLKVDGEWRIDNVTYADEGGTLREDCKDFYEDVVDTYRTTSPEEIMDFLSQEEPMEELYSDPDCIFYNNPNEIKYLMEFLTSCKELFKENPGYTEEYGKQIDAMIERISTHL